MFRLVNVTHKCCQWGTGNWRGTIERAPKCRGPVIMLWQINKKDFEQSLSSSAPDETENTLLITETTTCLLTTLNWSLLDVNSFTFNPPLFGIIPSSE